MSLTPKVQDSCPDPERIVAEYLLAREQGLPVSPQSLFEKYPQYAEELKAFLRERSAADKIAGVLDDLDLAPATLDAQPHSRWETVPTLPHEELSVGKMGHYLLLRQLGRGGMGVVYEALDERLERRIALKVLGAGYAATPDQIRRFRQEAQHAARLQHPHIVAIYDVGRWEELDYFTMEYIDGQTLSIWSRQAEHTYRARAELLKKIAAAIHFAHEQGVIHRDLKPGNILIDRQGQPHVADFGLARSLDENTLLTQSGVAVGTPGYMSPEQAEGQNSQLDRRTDVWGLGAIGYELLTGRPPFTGDNVAQILKDIVSNDPLEPHKLDRNVPRDLETICLKCLQKSPERRYVSAQALADDLSAWLNGTSIVARPPSIMEKTWRTCLRNPVRATSASLLLSFLCLALLWNFWQRSQTQQLAQEHYEAGGRALTQYAEENDPGRRELLLIEAEDRYRNALWLRPEKQAARDALQKAAMLHFEYALDEQNWRQAHEKLLLAHGAGLDEAFYRDSLKRLEKRQSERSAHIRSRVDYLMHDASAGPARQVHPAFAIEELISLKDPFTIEQLLPWLDVEESEPRLLAIRALAWMPDERTIRKLFALHSARSAILDLETRVELARALIVLAPENPAVFTLLEQEIARDAAVRGTPFFERIASFFVPYAQRRLTQKSGLQPGLAPEVELERLLREAQTRIALHRHDEAIQALDTALLLDPRNAAALRLRLKAQLERENFTAAKNDLERLLLQTQEDVQTLLLQARLEQGQGQNEASTRTLDRLLAKEPDHIEALLLRAQLALTQFRIEAAQVDIGQALKLVPDDLEAQLLNARMLLVQEQTGEALERLQALANAHPQSAAVFDLLAACHEQLENHDAALRNSEQACVLVPGNRFFLLRRSSINSALKRYDRALEDLKTLNSTFGRNPSFLLQHAQILQAQGQFEAALEKLNEIDAQDLYYPAALHQKARILSATGDYKKGIACLNEALQAQPYRQDWQRLLAEFYLQDRQYFEAVAICDRLLDADASDLKTLKIRAEARRKAGDRSAALVDFNRLLDVKPMAELYLARAQTLQAMGDRERAHRDLCEALRLDPLLTEALYLRSELDRYGRPAAALQDLETAVRLVPDDTRIRLSLSQFYLNANRHAEALAQIEHILSIDRTNADYYVKKANIYYRQKNYEQARTNIEQAKKVNPGYYKSYLLDAEIYMQEQKFEAARVEIERAIQLESRSAHARLVLANWHFMQQQYDEARTAANLALDRDIRYESAYVLLAQILERQKKPEHAIEILKKGVDTLPGSLRLNRMLGDRYRKNYDYQQALEIYAAALKYHPDDLTMLVAHARCAEQLEQDRDALKSLDRILELDPGNAYSLDLRARIRDGLGMYEGARTDYETLAKIEGADPCRHGLFALYLKTQNLEGMRRIAEHYRTADKICLHAFGEQYAYYLLVEDQAGQRETLERGKAVNRGPIEGHGRKLFEDFHRRKAVNTTDEAALKKQFELTHNGWRNWKRVANLGRHPSLLLLNDELLAVHQLWVDGRRNAIAMRNGSAIDRFSAPAVLFDGRLVTDIKPDRLQYPDVSRPALTFDPEEGYILTAIASGAQELGRDLLPVLFASKTGQKDTWQYLGIFSGLEEEFTRAKAARRNKQFWSDGGSLFRLETGGWRFYCNGFGVFLSVLEADALTGPWKLLKNDDGSVREFAQALPRERSRGGYIFPHVVKTGEKYFAIFCDQYPSTSIWMLESDDGMEFKLAAGNPVLAAIDLDPHSAAHIEHARCYYDRNQNALVVLVTVQFASGHKVLSYTSSLSLDVPSR